MAKKVIVNGIGLSEPQQRVLHALVRLGRPASAGDVMSELQARLKEKIPYASVLIQLEKLQTRSKLVSRIPDEGTGIMVFGTLWEPVAAAKEYFRDKG